MDPLPKDGATMRIVPGILPSDAIAFVGGSNFRAVFERNKKKFVIYYSLPTRSTSIGEDQWNAELDAQWQKEAEHILPLMHSLLPTFDFQKSNVGYLIKRDGTYSIHQKYKHLPKVSCPTWAPLVSMEDITLTRFFSEDPHHRGGLWRGRQIDLWMAYDHRSLQWLDNMMRTYLMCADLDLTYKVLAHLVDGEGAIIGLISEPATGRQMEYRDKSLLYDAITRLHQRNIVLASVQPMQVHVQKGKVRIADLLSLKHYPKIEDLEFFCQRGQFSDLADFFSKPPDPTSCPKKPTLGWPHAAHDAAWLLAMVPSPEVLLSAVFREEQSGWCWAQRSQKAPRKNKASNRFDTTIARDSKSYSLVWRHRRRGNDKPAMSSPYSGRSLAVKILSPELSWDFGEETDGDFKTLDGSDSATLCSVDRHLSLIP